jgi:putative addiction module killer protein
MPTIVNMLEVVRSNEYAEWEESLGDSRAKAKVITRIQRLAAGNAGDVEPVGAGISELRIDFGPGYRVYFCQKGRQLVVLLCGGDKSSQRRDIKQAKAIAARWK